MADQQSSMADMGFGSGQGMFSDNIHPQLDALESGLKALQEGRLDAHGLADLWRHACTIKDKALARGIHDVCAAAQLMEEAMHMVSHNESQRTPEMIGFLQELKDNIVQGVEKNDVDLPLDSLRQAYHALIDGEARGEASPANVGAITQSFYAEVKQQLTLAHRCLVAMGNGDMEDEGLEALHRLAGNIRISATMMGIEDVADAGHFLEDASDYLIRYPEQRGPIVGRQLLDVHDQLYARLDEHEQPLPMENIRQSFINVVMESKRSTWVASRSAEIEPLRVAEVEAESESPSALQNEVPEPAGEAVSDASPPSEVDEEVRETQEDQDSATRMDWDMATGDVSEASQSPEQGGDDAAIEDAPGFDLQSHDVDSLQLDGQEHANGDEELLPGMGDWSDRTVELRPNAAAVPVEDRPIEEAEAPVQDDADEEEAESPFVEWAETELEMPADASDMSEGEPESSDEMQEADQIISDGEASNALSLDWEEAKFALPEDEYEQAVEDGAKEMPEQEDMKADLPECEEPAHGDGAELSEEAGELAAEAEAYDFRPDVPELASEAGLGHPDGLVHAGAERLAALVARVDEFSMDASGTEAIVASMRSMLKEMQDTQDMWPSIRRGPSGTNIGEYKADLQSMDAFLYRQPKVTRQMIKALSLESDRQALLADDVRGQLKALMKGSLFSQLPAHVQHLAHKYDRQLRLCVDGASVELLCSMMEAVEEVLLVLLEHAIAHGVESLEERMSLGKPEIGQLTIAARRQAGEVLLEVINDGCGLDPDLIRQTALSWGVCDHETLDGMNEDAVLRLIFAPGMPAGGSDENQRVGGMSAVQGLIRGLGGRMKVHSELGRGTCLSLKLPLGVPLRSAIVLRVRGHRVGILSKSVLRMIGLGEQEIMDIDGTMAIAYAGEMVKLVDLRGQEGGSKEAQQAMIVVAHHAEGLIGMVVDGFEDNRKVELFEPDTYIERCCPGVYEGVTILDDGSILLLVNPAGVVGMLKVPSAEVEPPSEGVGLQSDATKGEILLMNGVISDNSLSEEMLQARGYHVDMAADGEAMIERLDAQPYNLVVVDLDIANSGGLKLVQRVRNHDRLEYVPIMAISMSGRPEDRLRGLEAGADAYIEKQNLDLDNFLNTVDALIHIYKAQIPDDAVALHEHRSAHDPRLES
ncbi:MAG: response regulator [Mariprofundaceae bacterium]